MKVLIIDGGTTNLRVHLVDASARQLIASKKTDGGVRYTAIDGHNGRLVGLLRAAIHDILEENHCAPQDIAHCIAYGMITSGMGLIEIPHLAAPVSASDLADASLTRSFPDICPFPVCFIPGVRNFSGSVDLANCSDMDMMRGEETEAVGLFSMLQPEDDALFVLPGSHNKFVHMLKDGRITGCMTSVSGELLDTITNHTILSDAVGHQFLSEPEYDPVLVLAGARECMRSGLGRAVFAGRILNTLGGESPAVIRNWLLGAVLSEDIKAMETFTGHSKTRIYVAGKNPVQSAFIDLLQSLKQVKAAAVDAASTALMGIHGALQIAGI